MNALREFVKMPELESFWDLEMDANEQAAVATLSALVRGLETQQRVLSVAIKSTAAVCSHLTSKRDVRRSVSLYPHTVCMFC